jgi:hypothetical protein
VDGYTPEKGLDYFDGKDGVSIVSIEQTTQSDMSGGINILTIKLSDGTQTKFMVRNAEKGEKGDKGDTGKTAYEYAKEGGYEGTEAEFIEKNAMDPKRSEEWKFTLKDGRVITRAVFVND